MEIQPCLGYIQVGIAEIFLDIFLYFLAQLLVLAVPMLPCISGVRLILPLPRKICP